MITTLHQNTNTYWPSTVFLPGCFLGENTEWEIVLHDMSLTASVLAPWGGIAK